MIRSAGDDLAEGVVGEGHQIRKYGELVRSEGRRLSEMVEQILEFAGIQSGQRKFEPGPVQLRALVDEVLSASAALLENAGANVEIDIPEDLPPVLGDERALRRVFQSYCRANPVLPAPETHVWWLGVGVGGSRQLDLRC